MKTVSKLSRVSIGVLGGILLLSIPSTSSFAAPPTSTNSSSAGTCAHIASLQTASDITLTNKMTDTTNGFKSQLDTVTSSNDSVSSSLKNDDQTASTRFQATLQAALASASLTTTQKQAITSFQNKLLAAEKTRETTITQARDAFHTGLLVLLQTQQSDLTDALTNFKDNITADFAKAESTCSSDLNALASLKTSIAADRSTLTHAINPSDVTTNVKKLITNRNTLIQQANQTFVSTVQNQTKTVLAALQ